MTNEDKQLLLTDLCGRLPYGVKYVRDSWNYELDEEMSVVEVLEDIDREGYINNTKVYQVDDIKPYLRPLSSMTKNEYEEFKKLDKRSMYRCTVLDNIDLWFDKWEIIEWFNTHHFDYRGLIEKGLALEASNDMY